MIVYNSIKWKPLLTICLFILFDSLFTNTICSQGPTQPESVPSNGGKNNVNLFTGDFKYTIPLFEIDGYPINLSYSSNIGVNDEASWVGLGWSLNPGAINRIMRGVPDEFNGDKIKKEFYIRPNWTAGVNIGKEVQIANFEPVKFININGSGIGMGVGVFYNSYNGLGTEISLGANMNIGAKVGGFLTGGVGTGAKITSNSQKGVTTMSHYGIRGGIYKNEQGALSLGVSGSSSFNNRTHFKNSYQGMSLNLKLKSNSEGGGGIKAGGVISGSNITNEMPTYMPKIEVPMKTNAFSFEAKVGKDIKIFNYGGSISGYYSKESVANRVTEKMAYGYINYQNAKNNKNAILDFNRENEVPYHDKLPYIAIPNPTNDIFIEGNSFTGGTYRPHRTLSTLYDPLTISTSSSDFLSAEANFGDVFEGGVTISNTNVNNISKKWERNNTVKDIKGQFSSFKDINDLTPMSGYINSIGGEDPVFIGLDGNGKRVESISKLEKEDGSSVGIPSFYKGESIRHRILKPYTFDKKKYGINSYTINDIRLSSTEYSKEYYKDHHIAGFIVRNTDGSSYVYGVPTYSIFSEDVTFGTDRSGGATFQYSNENSSENARGKDNYFNKESMPAYPTSWLITSVLYDNYVDVGEDGVTDDDLGNAVKFNYTKTNDFKWRLPRGQNIAKFIPGKKSVETDNKGMYSWGEREDWYLHSVESKTQLAQFYISSRLTNFGVEDENGTPSSINRYKIDSIVIYSKKDIADNTSGTKGLIKAALKPLKRIYFEYDYSLGGDRLTLKSVYFGHGTSNHSLNNRYVLRYGENPGMGIVLADRWGKYKDLQNNPSNLTNSDYPYTIQEKSIADLHSKSWLLSKIELPTGGEMEIEYEADDYAYVQNRRAQKLFPVTSAGSIFSFQVDPSLNIQTEEELIDYYFRDPNIPEDNLKNLYFKCNVELSDGKYEDISGYAEIEDITLNNNMATVRVSDVEGTNPVMHAGWRFMKTHTPELLYPNSQIDLSITAPADIVLSLIGNIADMVTASESFNSYALRKGFAKNIKTDKSFIRLCVPDRVKYGGGARVKQILVKDNWDKMTGAPLSKYGQVYEYTKKEGNQIISSGVAEYEPIVGGDENPFKQPINFSGPKGLFDPHSFTSIELPIGESFFPSASVGYSEVKVTTLASKQNLGKGTGYSINEFYTAKEFPVKTSNTNLTPNKVKKYEPEDEIGFFSQESRKYVTLSQGFAVETNDMHGKPKASHNYNQQGTMVSSINYIYKTNLDGGLSNIVSVADKNQVVSQQLMGVDAEFAVDMRESRSLMMGDELAIGGGFFFIGIVPIPWVLPFPSTSERERRFRSLSTIKIVRTKGILESVIANNNGSVVRTKNLVWDRESGKTILSKINNDYNAPTYKLNYPAYWVYPGMGPAYKGGLTQTNLKTNNKLFSIRGVGLQNLIYANVEEQLIANNPIDGGKIEFKNNDIINEKTSYYSYAWPNLEYDNSANRIEKEGMPRTISNHLKLSSPPTFNHTSNCMIIATIQNIIQYYSRNPSLITPVSNTPISSILPPNYDWLSNNSLYNQFRFSNSIDANTPTNFISLILNDIQFDISAINPFLLSDLINTDLMYNLSGNSVTIGFDGIPDISGSLIHNSVPYNTIDYYNKSIMSYDYKKTSYGKWKIKGVLEGSTSDLSNNDYKNKGIFTNSNANINSTSTILPLYMMSNKDLNVKNVNEYIDLVEENGYPIQIIKNAKENNQFNKFKNDKESIFASFKRENNGKYVTIQASNAMYNEIIYTSFENIARDQSRKINYIVQDIRIRPDNVSSHNISEVSHTGSRSLRVANDYKLFEYLYTKDNYEGVVWNKKQEFMYESPVMQNSVDLTHPSLTSFFEPAFNKEYVVSVWVKKENSSILPNPEIKIKFSNDLESYDFPNQNSNSILGPSIEGWQKLEVFFKLPPIDQTFAPLTMSMELVSPQGTATYFDDLRIIPLDARAKSFVYDYTNLRKVAELDENHYATFFDYDEEGKLIRTRKETDRGVMTINENRWSLKK